MYLAGDFDFYLVSGALGDHFGVLEGSSMGVPATKKWYFWLVMLHSHNFLRCVRVLVAFYAFLEGNFTFSEQV